ncbi:hydroxyethylthiazole kinase, partial [Acinetobacter baumannii]
MNSTSNLIEQVIEAWQNMQAKTPLVQCITNSVAANYTANVLLASGASPAMIDNPYEAESFTKISSALSIN